MSASQVWLPRRFDEAKIRDTSGGFLNALVNTYRFFADLANLGWSPSEQDPAPADRPALDRWLLSRLARVERAADERLTRFDAYDAARLVMDFVETDVSKWYVRLSRARFWADDRAAFATLHETLVVVCRLLAPIMPFVTDWIHRELTGASVHLSSFVRADPGPTDDALEMAMDDVRVLAGLGHTARETARRKTRQPLSRLVCVTPRAASRAGVERLASLLASELNVKRVEFLQSADALVTLTAKANYRTLGKKFGKGTPLAAQAVAAFTSSELAAFQHGAGPLYVTVDGQTHHLDPEDLTITHQTAGELVVEERDGYLAAVDPTITADLEREGLARETIRAVQNLRKDTGLAVSDRIRLCVAGDPAIEAAVQGHREWIAGEVLAREIVIGNCNGEFDAERDVPIDGRTVRFALTREVER